MRTRGIVYANATIPSGSWSTKAPAGGQRGHLPGILGHSLAMPDIHWGYGFPIGGVAAFDLEGGGHIARRSGV